MTTYSRMKQQERLLLKFWKPLTSGKDIKLVPMKIDWVFGVYLPIHGIANLLPHFFSRFVCEAFIAEGKVVNIMSWCL